MAEGMVEAMVEVTAEKVTEVVVTAEKVTEVVDTVEKVMAVVDMGEVMVKEATAVV
jgi:hypothetical protein